VTAESEVLLGILSLRKMSKMVNSSEENDLALRQLTLEHHILGLSISQSKHRQNPRWSLIHEDQRPRPSRREGKEWWAIDVTNPKLDNGGVHRCHEAEEHLKVKLIVHHDAAHAIRRVDHEIVAYSMDGDDLLLDRDADEERDEHCHGEGGEGEHHESRDLRGK
jgi:hypothetical protein